jgi:hypothetical protein
MLQDPDTFVWNMFADNIMANTYVVSGLTSSQSYTFAVKSRNIVGLSTVSQAITLVACEEPDTPPTPMTTIDEVANTITISWQKPSENGTPITSYTILIRSGDLETYMDNLSDCDGSKTEILSARQCTTTV